MVRSELESKLAEQNPNILRKDIEKIVNVILIAISEALVKGENIEIRGFGSYKVKIRKARIGRNPKNSKTIKIPEKKAIKWKMSKTLFNKINNNFTENKISGTY